VTEADSRISGTWANVDGSIWTFDSDGTGSREGGNLTRLKWTVLEGKVVMFLSGSAFSCVYNYYFSGDEKELFLIRINDNNDVIWLKKKE
jgi:hypothetical protein